MLKAKENSRPRPQDQSRGRTKKGGQFCGGWGVASSTADPMRIQFSYLGMATANLHLFATPSTSRINFPK